VEVGNETVLGSRAEKLPEGTVLRNNAARRKRRFRFAKQYLPLSG
jgi:hypothetical protein